jgi:hypothetical protein
LSLRKYLHQLDYQLDYQHFLNDNQRRLDDNKYYNCNCNEAPLVVVEEVLVVELVVELVEVEIVEVEVVEVEECNCNEQFCGGAGW